MFRLACKPEGPIDTLSDGLTETVWIQFNLGLFIFLEGARHEAVGCYPLVHSERPCHAEMVRFARMAGRWITTTFLRGFLQPTRLAGSTSAHLTSKSQVLISLRATDGVVFDWCSGLLANLKDQLTHCWMG